MNADALNALDQAVAIARERGAGRVPIVGVAGPQGSGKSTLVSAYAGAHPGTAHLSLDDVYLPASYRALIAKDVHPLFATRGPPGTHNLTQLDETLDDLMQAGEGDRTLLPSFDKVTDNPVPEARRPVFAARPSLILIDGWCLGATGQTADQLADPVNALEAQRDAQRIWRTEVNANLGGAYQPTFARMDAMLYLRAPSFDVVQDWRCEQEEGLLGRDLTEADRQRVGIFIQFFERITLHMMNGGRRADVEVQLDPRRNVTEVKHIPA